MAPPLCISSSGCYSFLHSHVDLALKEAAEDDIVSPEVDFKVLWDSYRVQSIWQPAPTHTHTHIHLSLESPKGCLHTGLKPVLTQHWGDGEGQGGEEAKRTMNRDAGREKGEENDICPRAHRFAVRVASPCDTSSVNVFALLTFHPKHIHQGLSALKPYSTCGTLVHTAPGNSPWLPRGLHLIWF